MPNVLPNSQYKVKSMYNTGVRLASHIYSSAQRGSASEHFIISHKTLTVMKHQYSNYDINDMGKGLRSWL